MQKAKMSNSGNDLLGAGSGQPAQKPEYIRLPRSGTACPHTGLKRSLLNELILPSAANGFKPPVKSLCLRRNGNIKGIRLIVFESLLAYLRGLENEQTKNNS